MKTYTTYNSASKNRPYDEVTVYDETERAWKNIKSPFSRERYRKFKSRQVSQFKISFDFLILFCISTIGVFALISMIYPSCVHPVILSIIISLIMSYWLYINKHRMFGV